MTGRARAFAAARHRCREVPRCLARPLPSRRSPAILLSGGLASRSALPPRRRRSLLLCRSLWRRFGGGIQLGGLSLWRRHGDRSARPTQAGRLALRAFLEPAHLDHASTPSALADSGRTVSGAGLAPRRPRLSTQATHHSRFQPSHARTLAAFPIPQLPTCFEARATFDKGRRT